MALTATFDSTLSRVRLFGTSLTGASTALIQRSTNNVRWTTVRGGTSVTVASNSASLDDYEFTPGVVNYYKVVAGANTFTTSITPAQTGVWLKSITRPFLNVGLTNADIIVSDITRPARNGIFEVMDRTYPVARTGLRSSRRWNMSVRALTVADANRLDLVFASGDPLFIQTDGTKDIPGGYVVVGDVSRTRFGTVSNKRWFELPLTEVAAPGPDVVGNTVTWAAIKAEFATWTALKAAFAIWADVKDYVADPEAVIVP